jgi:uncharacterized membrane protein
MSDFVCTNLGDGPPLPRERGSLPVWQRIPIVPAGLAGILLAYSLFEPVRGSVGLTRSFWLAGIGLLAWAAILWAGFRRSGRAFRIEPLAPLRSHYIQATVQSCIYAYWGWYWGAVYSQIPLILAQFVFLYAFDGLLSWSRGRSWRLSCGPLPIILSTNVFLWFKEDWFVFQFLLVALGALGKEFIRWEREGRRTHVFNPSSFTLAVFALVLIATGTSDVTWAGRIADTFSQPPQIYVLIFVLGLLVQFFFSTTLMTCSAVVMLCVLNWIYKSSTGTYFFVFSNIPAPVFLGLHLLVTDPATSPRSSSGKILFGALYGLLVFVCYGLLTAIGAPTVYDKLLPVPILNLSVRWIERAAAWGWLGDFQRWAATLQPRRLNLISMGGWAALFMMLLSAGYVQGQQEGSTFQFWQQACLEGRPGATRGLLALLKASASEGSSAAMNELGMVYLEGKYVEQDKEAALRHFAKACKMGSVAGSANVATVFLQSPSAPSSPLVELAFDQLEQACRAGADGPLYYLVARAYETGRARPQDSERALALYDQGCERGNTEACRSLTRLLNSRTPLPD